MRIASLARLSAPLVNSYEFPAVIVLVVSLSALAITGAWMLRQRVTRTSPSTVPPVTSASFPQIVESVVDDLAATLPKAPQRAEKRVAATGWRLETEHGQRVTLTKPTVIVGRDPRAPEGVTDAQLVALKDCEFSVSKTHARLDLVDGSWVVTDLHSTNGVRLAVKPAFLPEDKIDVGVPAHAAAHLSFGTLSARILRLS